MRVTILSFLAALIAGCSGVSGGSNDLPPVRGKVILQLRETYPTPDGVGLPQPTLLLETSEEYPCDNYEIRSRVRIMAGVLTVDVLGAELDGCVCFTAIGPARAQVVIPRLAECNRIVVRYRGNLDQYALAVDDTTFRMSGQDGSFTRIGDTLVWRFPRKSMVYTCGTLTEDSCLCQQFRDSLLAYLDLQPIEVPATGSWPYPKETIGYYYNMSPLVYRYSSESEFQRAGALLAAFTRATLSDRQGVGLALNNWRNEQHASWLVRASTIPGR